MKNFNKNAEKLKNVLKNRKIFFVKINLYNLALL